MKILHIIHSHCYKENLLAWLASRQIEGCNLVTKQHGLPESHHEKVPLPGCIKSAAHADLDIYFDSWSDELKGRKEKMDSAQGGNS